MTERTKRKPGEDKQVITTQSALSKVLSDSITSYESAKIAIIHLMYEYSFSPTILEQVLQDQGLSVSFSHVKYNEIAPFVGLDPARLLRDIGTFELHRSRIPTDILKSIIEDMDHMLMQYGSLMQHSTEEATSRFLSPIFNRLIAEFGFTFRNLPESLIKGRITMSGRIGYYFRAFGAISVLVVEVKLKSGASEERLNAIARVIAECDACNFNNSAQDFTVPVFGILWDGTYFNFFRFEGTSKPFSFRRGAFPNDPLKFRLGIKLPDLTTAEESALPFMQTIRLISETVFDILLFDYISSIKAFKERDLTRSTEEQSLTEWEGALAFANQALQHFQDADSKCQHGEKTKADHAVSQGQMFLKHSLEAIPEFDPMDFLLMPCWNDDNMEFIL